MGFRHQFKRFLKQFNQKARKRTGSEKRSYRPSLEGLERRELLTGFWTQINTQNPTAGPPGGTQAMMLLSNGEVLIQSGNNTPTSAMFRLTPDLTGNYITGTWGSQSTMNVQRLFFNSAVLPDGRIFAVGGEYSTPFDFTNAAEIYDPVTNKWTAVASVPTPPTQVSASTPPNAPPAPQSQFGDDPIEVLPNGDVLAGYFNDPTTYVYHPATNTWRTTTGAKLRNDRSDEETWVKLPDGSILSYDVFSSELANRFQAQRFVPALDQWVDASTLDPLNPPSVLTNTANFGAELGPALLLPSGDVFLLGANGNTAYYHPSINTWTAAPRLPIVTLNNRQIQLGATDDPAAMLPNGKVLLSAAPSVDPNTGLPFTGGQFGFPPPVFIFEFDPATGVYTDVTPPTVGGINPFAVHMLVLPTGQVMLADQLGPVLLYNPDGAPLDQWRPTIQAITDNKNGTFTLTGTQLNGISEGSNYGDDWGVASNYPIVRLTDKSGKIFYARTFNWSSTGVATGSTTQTVQFTPPPNTTIDQFTTFTVIANGISSLPFQNSSAPGTISGLIWNDIDQDLIRDTNPLEPGIPNLVVYIDSNNDGKLGLLEKSALTDHNGRYTLTNIPPGTFTLRVLGQPGITAFTPITTIMESNKTLTINFPNGTTPVITLNQDFGDAPDSYGTTLAANGARHGVLPGFELGATVTADPNGQPSVGATADTSDDGIVFGAGGPTAIITPGATADLTVTVNTSGFLPGKLQGWVDFNHNGVFDSTERVITNVILGTGVHHVTFPVPANLATGSTYARFRYGYESNLGPTGPSTAGEVEDYQVTALANVPIAKDDDLTAILLKPGVTTGLNVLANDSGTTFGAPKIFSVDTSTLPAGTIVTINAAQDTIFITPGPTAFGPYSFTYKVTDNSGRPPAQSVSSPGTVKINVTLSDPKVVDDFVSVPFTAPPQQVNIQALANDLLPVPNAAAFQIIQGSVQLITPNAPPGAAGAMQIAAGGKSLNFTAPAGFHGTLVYQYTINEVPDDPTTAAATGRVTVQVADVVAGVPQPDLSQYVAQLSVDILDSSHQVLSANSFLHPGDFFYVRVQSRDLRPITGAPRGMETAYLDLLFDSTVAKPVLSPENPLGMSIAFDGEVPEATSTVQANPAPTATTLSGNPAQLNSSDGFYVNHTLTFTSGALNGQSGWIIGYSASTGTFTFGSNTFSGAPAAGDTFELSRPVYFNQRDGVPNSPGPGSIDEAGGFTAVPPGSSTTPVFTVLMQVQAGTAGQNLQVRGDPADNSPKTDISVPADPQPGDTKLADEQVFLRPSPTIPVVQLGGGEFSNRLNRLDVSNDGFVAPDDALLVINEVNSTGARTLSMADMAAVGFAPPTTFIDVDMDSVVTPTDALLIINYLNSLPLKASTSLSGGEGEASGDPVETLAFVADARAEEAAADTAVQDVLDEPDPTTTHVINTMSLGGQTQPQSTSLMSLTPFFASTYRSASSTTEPMFHGTSINPDAADELFGGLADEEE